jgi:membrane-associated HD superfamily phosphohydrolase
MRHQAAFNPSWIIQEVNKMTLTKQLISLCFFKNSPVNIRASKPLLYKTTAVYFIFSLVLDKLFVELTDGIIQTLLDLLLAMLFVAMLFFVTTRDRKKLRFLQSMIAILGCQTVITLSALPIGYWMVLVDEKHIWIPIYCLPLLAVWNIAVVGNILSQELGKNRTSGFYLACVFFSASFLLSTLMTVV